MGTDDASAALSIEPEIPDAPMMNVTSISGIPRDGLLVEYLFEDNAQDSSGLGNHAFPYHASYDASRFGQSLEISPPAYVQTSPSSMFDLLSIRDATVAFWVRRTPDSIYYTVPGQQFTVLGYSSDPDFSPMAANDRRVYFK